MTHRVFIVMKDDYIKDIEVSSIQKVFYNEEKAREYINNDPHNSYWILEEYIH